MAFVSKVEGHKLKLQHLTEKVTMINASFSSHLGLQFKISVKN